MTAEIAILNKAAVALAADSAITISAGTQQEKIFDSADKLFELSGHNPVGVMIYNNMSFMEAPLPSLIRQFRLNCKSAENVIDIANNFLNFLNEFGASAPKKVRERSVSNIITPLIAQINADISSELTKLLEVPENFPKDISKAFDDMREGVISIYEAVYSSRPDAIFYGGAGFNLPDDTGNYLRRVVIGNFPSASDEHKERLLNLVVLALRKDQLSNGLSGIVIAGFGSNELFPSLVSFEIDGIVGSSLKYIQTNVVKIEREGTKAQVIPFAQKEMVERFLYGLDEGIQEEIADYCDATVSDIRTEMLKHATSETEESKKLLDKNLQNAEQAFVDGLKKRAFRKIREQSRAEIDDMVEFMPKPELAKMAEALVNLTSIKRRVSRGMETVGGPIDVAVISQSEGFVWIKRKHYFPAELNARYFNRVRERNANKLEIDSGQNTEYRPPSKARKAKAGGPFGRD